MAHPGKSRNSDMPRQTPDKWIYLMHLTTQIGSIFIALIYSGMACFIAYMIMNGIVSIAANTPEQIGAFSKLIEALHLESMRINVWLPWGISWVTTGAWALAWQSKKKAKKEISRLRALLEAKNSEFAHDNSGNGHQTRGR